MIFSSKYFTYYVFTALIIIIVSYFANQWKKSFESDNEERELIQNFLLNDTPLYGHNRPKLWIHTTYDINARKWKTFSSRNTTDLNQPYIHLTIKTIINHCGDDFNVCLIDDESFSRLLPSWEIDLSRTPEPMRTRYRELGILQLIYLYGGLVVPNSFVCLKNMKEFYENNTSGNNPFVCEKVNQSENLFINSQKLFTPSTYIMGANKGDQTVLELANHLKDKYKSGHFTSENEFLGEIALLCSQAIRVNKMNLVGGELVGVKSNKKEAILLENLIEEDYLDLDRNAVGIYIPMDQVLQRTKYQWFAVLSSDDILNSNMIISKYLTASIVDTTSEYNKNTEVKSTIVSI